MRLDTIKEMMIEWVDFYGQDICATDKIAEATTKKQLLEVINNHIKFLEMQNIDAITHSERFKKSLNLE